MKNLVIALAVAVGLCTYAAPQASAQTAKGDATTAMAKYSKAMDDAATAYNAAKVNGTNWTLARDAYWFFAAAYDNAQWGQYYYSVGDHNNGDRAMLFAMGYSTDSSGNFVFHSGASASSAGQDRLNQIVANFANNPNPTTNTVYNAAVDGLDKAKKGDSWAWQALSAP